MAGGKETPRQKMIGMMYLVLTALLALNVTKEVINAFITLNDKIEAGNTIIKNTMDAEYGSFDIAIAGLKATKAAQEDIDKVKELQSQALLVKDWSMSTCNFFVEQADNIIKESGDGMYDNPHYTTDENGYYTLNDISELDKKDDYDTPTRLFIGDNPKKPKGQFVLDTIHSYRDRLCELIANYTDDKGVAHSFKSPDIHIEMEGDIAAMKQFDADLEAAMANVHKDDKSLIKQIFSILTPPDFTINHEEKINWIGAQFDHSPTVAAIAMLTSIRSDILQAENKAVTHIASRVSAPKFNFNKIEPLAFSKTGIINQGDSMVLSVMIAAYDSTENMKLKYSIDDSTMTNNVLDFNGKAGSKLKIPGGSTGEHTITGTIAVKEKGVEKYRPWSFKYNVAAPSAAVSPVDLQVLYSGWKNRLKVSGGGGFDPGSISVTCSGCSIKKEGEYYIATVSSIKGTATIKVSAKDPSGKSIALAQEVYRIFPLPKPGPSYAKKGIETTSMSVALAKACPPIQASMKNSPLDVKYSITGFKMVVKKGNKTAELKSSSGKLTSEMKAAVKAMGKGSVLMFMGIKAKGPSGKSVPIGNLLFRLE